MSLITPAMASSPATTSTTQTFAGFDPILIVQIVLFIGVFYYFMIRPQQKRAKQHQEMVGALKRGDRIVTSGGILGTVHKIENDTEVSVDIAENVRVRVLRSTIATVLSKTEVATNEATTIKKHA